MSKKVLVTGIGGNVGQGILRNIAELNFDIKTIGTNTSLISGGNHLCDKAYMVPFSSSSNYIPIIQKICHKEVIDLIIPSTDYEVYFLTKFADKLPPVAASDNKSAAIFLNKYLTWQVFTKLSLPFAKTVLPSQYKNNFTQIIVKPIEGRGSRGIQINPDKPKSFSDDFVVQEFIKGVELTTAFYITKEGRLLGLITLVSQRSHVSGATEGCEVIFKYDKQLEKIIKVLTKNFGIRGSCNLQSIVNEREQTVPFEVNCRISGTNSIRTQFGFEDVRYTLEEYLFNKKASKPNVKLGAATRILMDVIYPDIGLHQIKDKSTKHYIF